jgi:catechol 2,3-dioxygenase-like lactoylglutathione lyase family enzyme
MAITGPYGVVLEVPDIEPGVKFYTDAGLEVEMQSNSAHCSCVGQDEASIILVGGAARKRLHHLVLRTTPSGLSELTQSVPPNGGKIVSAPDGFADEGLWLRDPHQTLIHVVTGPTIDMRTPAQPFEINEPGRIVRQNRSGVPARASQAPVRPLRLGHVLLYTPDVMGSVDFYASALGLGLSDYSGDVVAFMCARKDSDHHIVAFAKSSEIGFHHASFQVRTPDDVGRGGRRLAELSKRGDWGFGRHTVGANFFHYIQDPWGSWFEYFSDMDYISDYESWTPKDYPSEDSLYNWGPAVPRDFVHNYEADRLARVQALGFS